MKAARPIAAIVPPAAPAYRPIGALDVGDLVGECVGD